MGMPMKELLEMWDMTKKAVFRNKSLVLLLHRVIKADNFCGIFFSLCSGKWASVKWRDDRVIQLIIFYLLVGADKLHNLFSLLNI